jgi:hypothetical protein
MPVARRYLAILAVCFGTVTIVSCGGSDTQAPPVATTIAASSATSLTAVAGAAVSERPAVIVKDQNGNGMAGAAVTFAVTGGGGSLSGGSVVTDANGIATVGAWTLGATVGANTMTATTASLPTVTFTATGTVGPAASITKTGGDNQSATAGAAVASAPSVTVKDANGNSVSGAAVTFTVASGGGSVTGASQTTNSSGVATVGSWTLGATVGTNTVSATSGSLSAVTFTATGVVGPAASISKTAGDNQSALASAAVATAPSVTVKDANGNSVSGAAVTFTVASGGGSVTGASQTTNSSGVATVGGWTLGATAGTNTLTASSGTLSTTFSATATITITLEKTSGDNQSTLAGDPVGAPSVTVKQNGSPLANATVTFAAGTNGGTVTGGTQTTNSAGVATVGKWRLGAVGTSTLTVSTTGAPSVSFTATAFDPCVNGYELAVGVSKTWDIHNLDCLLDDGRRADSWLFTLASGTYQFTQTSSENGVALDLWTNTIPAAFIAIYSAASFNTASTTFKAIVPAGDYFVRAMNGAAGQTGNYTVTFNTASAGITNCEYVFVMKGVTTTQSIANTDCLDSADFNSDDYWIWVNPNVSVTITMSSTAVNSYLILFNGSGLQVASNDNKTTSTNDAEITFTGPSVGGFYRIYASTAARGSFGAYTLTVK